MPGLIRKPRLGVRVPTCPCTSWMGSTAFQPQAHPNMSSPASRSNSPVCHCTQQPRHVWAFQRHAKGAMPRASPSRSSIELPTSESGDGWLQSPSKVIQEGRASKASMDSHQCQVPCYGVERHRDKGARRKEGKEEGDEKRDTVRSHNVALSTEDDYRPLLARHHAR